MSQNHLQRPRFAVVIQRYGKDIGGGAEEHAQVLSRALRRMGQVEVLTTCARDHHTWKNHYPAGISEDECEPGLRIRRFPVARAKNRALSFLLSRLLFHVPHPVWAEDRWMEILGPHSPELLRFLGENRDRYDGFLFYTYLYPTTVRGLPLVRDRAILIPTAHDEPMLRLKRQSRLLAQPAAHGFLTPEERDLVRERIGPEAASRIPGAVIGTEHADAPAGDAARFRRKFGIDRPFFLYLGRIERSKGCSELLRHWIGGRGSSGRESLLAFAGHKHMAIPKHASIRELGFLSASDKADALAACQALILPSRRESLSLVVLEAWAQRRPVLANGRCLPVAGQLRRSGGGLLYYDAASFAAGIQMFSQPAAAGRLGADGWNFLQEEYGRGSLGARLFPLLDGLGWLKRPPSRAAAPAQPEKVKQHV